MITRLLKYLLSSLCLTITGLSHADTIKFDALTGLDYRNSGDIYQRPDAAIPNGYEGLNWQYLYVINSSTTPTSGYTVGTLSPNNVMMIPDFTPFSPHYVPTPPATITAAIPFYFVSGYFTAAWLNGDMLEVVGKNKGTIAFDEKFTLSATATSFLTFPSLPITELDFSTSATNFNDTPYKGGGGEEVVADNLTIDFVPLPEVVSTAWLLAASAGGLALLRKRFS